MSVYKILVISLGSAKHKQISIETSNPQLHKKQAQIRGKTASLATLLSTEQIFVVLRTEGKQLCNQWSVPSVKKAMRSFPEP